MNLNGDEVTQQFGLWGRARQQAPGRDDTVQLAPDGGYPGNLRHEP